MKCKIKTKVVNTNRNGITYEHYCTTHKYRWRAQNPNLLKCVKGTQNKDGNL